MGDSDTILLLACFFWIKPLMRGRETLRDRLAALESKISNLRDSSLNHDSSAGGRLHRKLDHQPQSPRSSATVTLLEMESVSSSSASLSSNESFTQKLPPVFQLHSANSNAASNIVAEMELLKRRNALLEERTSQAEEEIALLHAAKSNVVHALPCSQQGGGDLHMEAQETERLVNFIREENSELLEIVEMQHSQLAQQQARAQKAERELHRLQNEMDILKNALQSAEEQIEELLEENQVLEMEMEAMELKMSCEVGSPKENEMENPAASQIYLRASANFQEVSQAAATLASLVSVSTSMSSSDSTNGERTEAQKLVMKQQELLKQQQMMMLTLIQKNEGQKHPVKEENTWTLSTTTLLSSTLAASLISAGIVFFYFQQRRKHPT